MAGVEYCTIHALCQVKHLRSIGSRNGLRDLGGLVASADNFLTRGVGDGLDVLVLGLGALPDLNLAAATKNANSHGGEKVVGAVGVVVDTTVEDSSGVLANGRVDEGLATGVVSNELANIVNDASDGNPGLAVLGLGDKVVPADNGQVLERNTPVKSGTLLVELLLKLLESALLNLVLGECLEVVCEAEELHDRDEPLGGVVLPPLNSVAEITWELVVEVVVTLTKGNEGSDDVISR